jgi:hypothetical protein
VGLACGGCPGCRRAQRPAYVMSSELESSPPPHRTAQTPTAPRLLAYTGGQSLLQLMTDSPADVEGAALTELIAALVGLGVSQMILPDALLEAHSDDLLNALQRHAFQPHLLLAESELDTRDLFDVPTVVIFGAGQPEAVFRRVQHWQGSTGNLLVYVVARTLELPSQHGRFVDRVGGHQEMVSRFLQWARERAYTL